MAAVSINITTTDEKGKSAVTRLHVPTGFSVAVYSGFAQAIAQLIANLQNGSITEIGVSIPLDISGLAMVGNALADVAEKAFFALKSSVAGVFSKLSFPTFNSAYTVDGSDALDESDPDVAAFISLIEDGLTLPSTEVIEVQDMRGNDIAEVRYGRELFRNQG